MLVKRHCETIKQMFDEFQTLYMDRAVGCAPSAEAMAVLHKLKGSSGTIGFSAVNTAVADFESKLREWPADPGSSSAYEGEQSRNLCMLRALIDGTNPEDSTLYGRKL